MQLLNIRQAAKFLNINPATLRIWDKTGKLKALKTSGNHRRYSLEMLEKFIGIESNESNSSDIDTVNVCATYARVSSYKQKVSGDLNRQSDRLKEYSVKNNLNVEYEIKDIGSGLNDKRIGFNRLTDLVISGKVQTVIIENKDRLTRFQYNFIKKIFNSYDCDIIVISDKETYTDAEELTTDMMSLLASFSGKYYGRRSSRNKKH